jgi:hypothetical protein
MARRPAPPRAALAYGTAAAWNGTDDLGSDRGELTTRRRMCDNFASYTTSGQTGRVSAPLPAAMRLGRSGGTLPAGSLAGRVPTPAVNGCTGIAKPVRRA